MAISPSTQLRIAPDVVIRYRSQNEVYIEHGPARHEAGTHGVAILEAFRTATPLRVALDQLGARATGMQDWIELSATISAFAREGILRDVAGEHAALGALTSRFDSSRVHVSMLNDRTRTQRYLDAIREVVRPGDVVVDLGTGTGVLAVAAAQAGASRVYAIEATRIGVAARAVFEANGVGDRVTLVEGLSSRVELPERADVLVSEIIGRDPLEEEILEFTRDAVQRFLKPEARLIPRTFEIFALPIMFSDEVRRGWTFAPEVVADWREWYGADFTPLVQASNRSLFLMTLSPKRLAAHLGLADPVRILDRDLGRIGEVGFTGEAATEALKEGRVDAVALFFAVELAPGIALTTDPREFRPDNSWDHVVWGLPQPLPVAPGDRIEVTLRHRVDGPPLEVRVGGAPT